MLKRKIAIPAGVFLFTLVFATTAFASADGHALPWGDFALRIVNLVIYLGIFIIFGGKKIAGIFKGRSKGIADNLAGLEKRKIQAEKDLADMEQRIANLEEERQAILKEYREQGEAIRASLIAAAQTEAASITAQAQKTARHETDQAIEKLRSEFADLMVEAAEKILPVKLSPEEQYQMVRKYLTKVVLN